MTEKMNECRTKLDNKIGEGREGKGRVVGDEDVQMIRLGLIIA